METWRWFQRKQGTDIKCWPRLFLPDCTLFYDVVLFSSGPPVLPSSDSRKFLFENYSRSAMLYWFTVQTFYWTSNSLADTGKNQNKNQVSNLISEKARNKETQSLSNINTAIFRLTNWIVINYPSNKMRFMSWSDFRPRTHRCLCWTNLFVANKKRLRSVFLSNTKWQ